MFILAITHFAAFTTAEKIGILEGILQPAGVAVRGDEAFILDGASVSVFSLDDLRLLRKFGREGQGPGEVETTPWLKNLLYVSNDNVVIDSVNKIVIFSRSGSLIKELRRSEQFTQMIPDSVHFAVYEDKIFIEESPKGFYIEVFDHKGKMIHAIQKDFEKIAVQDAHRREAEKLLSVDPFMRNAPGGWHEIKKTMHLNFPDSFPAIRDMVIADNKIYVQTYKKLNQQQQYIVLDLKGNELLRTSLPEMSPPGFTEQMMGTGVRLFDISHDRFYYIVETDEGSELHTQEIEFSNPPQELNASISNGRVQAL